MSSLVSVIMPAYNCEKFIKQSIDSILNQTYANFELLISDDASTDSTKLIIDSYSDLRIKRFHNETNLGYTKASNKLFQHVTGNLITFQDADDYSALNRLELLTKYLDAHPDCACVGSNIIKIDEFGKEIYKSNHPIHEELIREHFRVLRIVMTGSSLMIKKDVLDRVGGYHLYFDRMGSEDVYWYSLILDNFKVGNVADALYYYRTNSNSVTSSFNNPKSLVAHNLIVFLYNRRSLGRKDYLLSNNFKMADACCRLFILIDSLAQNKFKGLYNYLKLTLSYPSLGMIFFKNFMYKFFKQKTQ
ncbi:MAG: glycosyltransferase family 2 protein [Bacteroidota bacterium]